ncbi:hypothetical protein D9V34_05520 [Mycetocola lacteus]|uniref:Uncharacterized protein n=1 Tax=Mycetocola lacteus TaxID=76637 RepID=A0A3L7AVB1_9MICO|nr:hypothetical protein [Mycetocola lacteus]RLP83470.1 hypothetical protein D9V34_05520 [Mycetocola lacteus]
MKLSARVLPAAALLATLLIGGTTAAQAATPSRSDQVQDRVNQVLVEFPGGVQTGPGEVTWNGGETILNIVLEGSLSTFAVGNCATGSMCAYTSTGGAGSKISFTSCTATNSVAPLGSAVRSVANARSSGTAFGYNGSSPVLVVPAGSQVNTSASITRVGC